MKNTVRDVMTSKVTCLEDKATIREAARHMKDKNIGDVVVLKNGKAFGIVTDRDLVVRALAQGRSQDTTLGDICTQKLVTVSPEERIDRAIELMRAKAVRRLPVTLDGAPVGIVSLGDLARDRDPRSVLGTVSSAAPNN